MLVIDDRGPVRWLTLNRPQRMNAVPPEGWLELRDAFTEFEASAQRVLVVTGAGGDFCSGADLGQDHSDTDSMSARKTRMQTVGRAATTLHRTTKPTIAAVDGIAAGAGMNLALGCDVTIATTRARFSEIFVRRGLTVDFGGTWLLPRLVGLQKAKDIVFSGRIVEADEALSLGLVMEIVNPEDLEGRVGELAASYASGAPLPQMFSKAQLDRSFEVSFEEALEHENQAQAVCLGTEDAVEGVSAFLEKRSPRFEGR